MERKVIVIVGPTCSGKSSIGFQLAKQLNTEIISVDSRQVYKYLTIGTAKPQTSELKKIKHHFIDELDPADDFNVSQFEKKSLQIIERLFTENSIPIAVGGSGLYVKALVDGLFDEVDTDQEYREQMHNWIRDFGNEYLFNKLVEVDPVSASKMLPQNWKRVMRALEVCHITGKPIWQFHNQYERESEINFIQFGLLWQREKLYERINLRVDEMIEAGLVEEVESILAKGYSKELNSLNTVGYKEIIEYLDSKISLETAIELIKRNTRRYAKRQLTWFRKDERIEWLNVDENTDLQKTADNIIDKSKSSL